MLFWCSVTVCWNGACTKERCGCLWMMCKSRIRKSSDRQELTAEATPNSQGMNQGTMLSPTLYWYKLNISEPILAQKSVWAWLPYWYSVWISTPTCADNISLVTTYSFKLHVMLDNAAQIWATPHSCPLQVCRTTWTKQTGVSRFLGDEPVKTNYQVYWLVPGVSSRQQSPEGLPQSYPR